ncbi:DUF2243 domain-containing protein [Bacillus sp. Xin]|uniref:DUF2243 domain-containing protein n=1 Tax=unclassified Bacillus (in: firmicutes) TaxID=185979 RepID=UPI001572F796|nr:MULTISPECIES: DUF2243 domain-containing protein [unclassified Bacillus (in: firmicutes)]MBC6972795.1 DUF2243 domain-containing protein [Bacillus sp. Xin]NSW37256.1 DUF2243 domain-containing protein [Bacillus sp. Xin1]
MATETKNSLYIAHSIYLTRNLWSGILFGLGLVAFIDETIFHQLLHWHHFYDKSTTDIGLVSDGFFHAFSWFATISSLFMFADLRRKNAFWLKRWWGGIMVGGGGFQLYDGIIQHKVMKIHQIRYVENVLIYDLIWNILASVITLIGILIVFRTRRESKTLRGKIVDEQ